MSLEAGRLKKRQKIGPSGWGRGVGSADMRLALFGFCAQSLCRAATDSPGLARQWAAGQLRPLQRSPSAQHCLLSVGPDPKAAHRPVWMLLPPWELALSLPWSSLARACMFANNLIDFSNIHLLALALEKSQGRLSGQRPAASGGLTPHTRPDLLTVFASS